MDKLVIEKYIVNIQFNRCWKDKVSKESFKKLCNTYTFVGVTLLGENIYIDYFQDTLFVMIETKEGVNNDSL